MESKRTPTKSSPSCPRCGGRLRLRADQIGSQVICPKCNATFTVGRPGAPVTKPSVSAADDDAYEPEIPLTPSAITPLGPVGGVRSGSSRENKYDAYEPEMRATDPTLDPLQPLASVSPEFLRQATEIPTSADGLEAEPLHARMLHNEPDWLEVAKAKGLIDSGYVPDPPPQWTFFSDVFTFPWAGANLGRWAGMALGLSASGACLLPTVALLSAKGGASLGAPLLMVVTSLLLLVSGAFSAACFMTAIQDTADGHRRMQADSMPDWDQWFLSFIGLLNVSILSGALGYPLVFFESIGPLAIPISTAIFFPILMLSSLEAESFLLPFSRPIWGGLTRFPGVWLTFYVLSTALVAAWVAATSYGLSAAPAATLLLAGPTLAAVILIYARWLGRVVWRISDMTAATRERMLRDAADDTSGAARRRKRPRIWVEIPDGFGGMPAATGEPPAPLPRLDFRRR